MFVPQTQFIAQTGPVRASALTGRESLQGYSGPGRSSSHAIQKLLYKSHTAPVIQISTEHRLRLTVTPDHLVFVQCKPTNAYYDVFLVQRLGLGFVVGIGNGQLRNLTESTVLYEKQREGLSTITERSWIIASFRTLNQANYVEHLLSVRYGLPVFDVDQKLRRHGLSEEKVERLLGEVDTGARALRLLSDAGLSEAFPHFERKLLASQDLARFHFLDGVFYEPTDPKRPTTSGFRHVMRIYALGGGVSFDRDRIRNLSPGSARLESFEDPQDLASRLSSHSRETYTDVHRRIALPLGRPYFMWPAAYLREGMILPAFSGTRYMETAITEISRPDYSGDVVEIQLRESAQIVAGGILVGTTRDFID